MKITIETGDGDAKVTTTDDPAAGEKPEASKQSKEPPADLAARAAAQGALSAGPAPQNLSRESAPFVQSAPGTPETTPTPDAARAQSAGAAPTSPGEPTDNQPSEQEDDS